MKPSYLDIYKIKSPNQCLSWWLVHSWIYYVYGSSLLEDHEWDIIGKWLFNDWDKVTHRHRYLVDIELGASSAFYISEYPLIVQATAKSLIRWDRECKKRNKLALRRNV